MRGLAVKICLILLVLVAAPILGVCLSGEEIGKYLEFPPQTQYVKHEPFSWSAFLLIAIAEVVFIGPLAFMLLLGRVKYRDPNQEAAVRGFPWWGWVALGCVFIFWILAWTRFDWFSAFQAHTFFPLWLSHILVVNALTYARTGKCMLLNRTGYFLALFPSSAIFWWYFEYLNRFVQNWYYVGGDYGPLTYFLLASLSFSTVLPATLGVRDLLLSYDWFKKSFDRFPSVGFSRTAPAGWAILFISFTTLLFIGVYPNYLFPLVWMAPLMVIISLRMIRREPNIIVELLNGRWYPAVAAALAALICGFFWEMWNIHSLAKWEYTIPFVDRFHIFEMPVLGYAGYLPFGLECAVIGNLILEAFNYGGNAQATEQDLEK